MVFTIFFPDNVYGKDAEFEMYVTDDNGCRINAFFNETDNVYYIFMTCENDIQTVDLKYTSNKIINKKNQIKTLYNAFNQSTSIEITDSSLGKIRVKILQSDIPSLHISLNKESLEYLNADKNNKIKKTTIYITDNNEDFCLCDKKVSIKGRGNTSFNLFEKKGYQLEFSKDTSILGMSPAKKWVLIANANDDTLMRNYIAYSLSEMLGMPYTTNFRFVDLWIDGDYRGLYMIGEKIEIGENRIALKNKLGAIFELDFAFYEEEDYWFFDKFSGLHFTVKDSVEKIDAGNNNPDEINSSINDIEQISIFKDKFNAFFELINFTNPDRRNLTIEDLSKHIDVDSFAKYFLIDEFLLNREGFNTSFYWYVDGIDDLLHVGPVWDFDTSMGDDGIEPDTFYGHNNIIFSNLLTIPAFYEYTNELYRKNIYTFRYLSFSAKAYHTKIAKSAAMNFKRYNILGKDNEKGGTYSKTFDEACDFLKGWLDERYKNFKVLDNSEKIYVNEDISFSHEGTTDTNRYITITVYSLRTLQSPRLAIWSYASEQKDIKWYNFSNPKKGIYTCTIDTTTLYQSGYIMAHFYENNKLIFDMGFCIPAIPRTIPNKTLLETELLTLGDGVSGSKYILNH